MTSTRTFRTLLLAICLASSAVLGVSARSRILAENVKTMQITVNNDWMRTPVMRLGSGDVLTLDFDELSHNYHRFIAHIEHCEPDFAATEGLLESDWLEGFNDLQIENYENSVNTTVDYTHYSMQIPSEQCRLKMSGNYRISILDEDNGMKEVIVAEFRVVEPRMLVGLNVSANTDIDQNSTHQQVSMAVTYNGLNVTNPSEQIKTIVMQNGREDNMKTDVRPTQLTPQGLKWDHCIPLIFEAGNEYRKFEILDATHPTMGIESTGWDGQNFHAYTFVSEPRRNYIYDEDTDGAFCIRNSDDYENDVTSEYVIVHYAIVPVPHYEMADVVVDGWWTNGSEQEYVMAYDEEHRAYSAAIMQKQGYYSYQFLLKDKDGTTHTLPEEGNYYQTENTYEAFVYYKGTAERTWRLVGYQSIVR